MTRSTNKLIAEMAEELQPVRSLRLRDGVLLAVGALALTLVAVELVVGFWRGVWAGEASTFFILTNGLLLILGCASASTVLRMASPRVGNHHEGPRWASLGVAVLPVAALLVLLGHDHPAEALGAVYGFKCFGATMLTSSLTAVALFLWLRRGAPVSPAMAGLHLGVASTALGSVAFGFACPLDSTIHLGIWHVLPVLLGAVAGRFIVAPLLRW
ncbi:MAG: DUF1109 domain-containing protein [Halieaceae bacterium]|jgi:hypothetical protein|nr:DUF1109 domain-containing protein [Halieaceae bacterium]